MDRLQDHMRKNLAQRFRGRQAIGAIVFNSAQKFFATHDIEVLAGYVKFNKCFLKLADRNDQIRVHRLGEEFLEYANQKLQIIGYTVAVDTILFK